MKNTGQEEKKPSKNLKFLYAGLAVFIVALIIVTVTVILVKPSKLEKIELEALPNKTEYIEGQAPETEGMVVKAFYGKKTKIVEGYRLDKSLVQYGDEKITVSYTDGNITKTASYKITVERKSVTALEILSQPDKLTYIEGNLFDTTGLVVKIYYNNGESGIIHNWDYDKKSQLQITDEQVKISYGGKSVDIAIKVNPKILQHIKLESFPQKVTYEEGEYFDFLGTEIYAVYENAPTELIKNWQYDKTEPLRVGETSVEFSYTLHGITKTFSVDITVKEALYKDPEQRKVDSILSVFPPIEELTEDNLESIEYVLELLEGLNNSTQEHNAIKEELKNKRQEIIDSLPPVVEPEFVISYGIANSLSFDDIDYGSNPAEYKNSDGKIILSPAYSDKAIEQGYVFKGWQLEGQPITGINELSHDVIIYAEFDLTPTVDMVFLDSENQNELLNLKNIIRSNSFYFDEKNIDSTIYSACNVLAVAYYSENKERINSADLSFGKTVTVYVLTVKAREIHLSDEGSVTVGWIYEFNDGNGSGQSVKTPQTGTYFVVPVGAAVTMSAMHANIDDIIIDGISKGEKLNNSVVQAKFILEDDTYPASVTFKTVLNDMITLAFLGYNQFSVVYPSGWDGYIAKLDLDNLYFVYDEAGTAYLNTYTIDGTVYYFDELSSVEFNGDTQIWVNRVRNSFSFTVRYLNGTEKIEDIAGKQTVKEAFDKLTDEALEIVNTVFTESNLYSDATMDSSLSYNEMLNLIIRGNIIIYSDWEKPEAPPDTPKFDDVDYSSFSFVNKWSSLFISEGSVLSSELSLSADGVYEYKTFVNGKVSANISGIYRLEDEKLVIKTFNLLYDYQLVDINDLFIDIEFAQDGLIRASFIQLRETELTVFEHTLTCGNVRFVNYTNKDFVGMYEKNGVTIVLRANGTAILTHSEVTDTVHYRVNEECQLIILSNGVFGTGKIIGIFGGVEE